MVSRQQYFPQQRLTGAMRNGSEKVMGGIAHQFAHFLEISGDTLHTRVPHLLVGRRCRFRPITIRPRRRLVPAIPAELQNVPQRDTYVFEQLPGGVRESLGNAPAQLDREVVDGGAEIGMTLVPIKKLSELLTEELVLAHEASQKGNIQM